MIEFFLQIVAELLLQTVGEALVEFGLHSVAAPFRRRPNPFLAGVGYFLFGAVAGGLSLLIFRHHLVATGAMRLANLIVTPVAVGLLMCLLGKWRARRGDPVLRIDRFSYGYLFALAFALVRFLFAK